MDDQGKPGKAECTVRELLTDGTIADLPNDVKVEVYNLSKESVEADLDISCWHINGVPVAMPAAPGQVKDYLPLMVRVQVTAKLYSTNSPIYDWATAERRTYAPYTKVQENDPQPDDPLPPEPTSITNPFQIDCKANGYIWIARWETDPLDPNNPPPETEQNWYVVYSEQPHATKIEIEYGSSGQEHNVLAWWDGEKPGDTVPWDATELEAYLQPQQNVGDKVRLTYDNNSGGYVWDSWTKYRARWVRGSITVTPDGGGSFPYVDTSLSVEEFWDGYNPGSTVTGRYFHPLGFVCDEPITMKVTACWKPEAGANGHRYHIIASDSALMGPPTQIDIAKGGMKSENEMSGGEGGNKDGKLCFSQEMQFAYVFQCGDPNAPPRFQENLCVDGKELYEETEDQLQDAVSQFICDAICECDSFASSPECNPCTGECVWRWDEANPGGPDWVLDSSSCTAPCDCIDKPTGTGTEGQLVNVQCRQPPPTCGTCTWTWSGTIWEVLAGGDDCTGTCECGDAPTEPGTEVGQTVTQDCVAPTTKCCSHCGGQEITITNMVADQAPVASWSQTGPSVPTGDCSWTVPGEWGEVGTSAAEATVTYDGTTWTVSIPNSPENNVSGNFSATGGCDGSFNCSGGGDCGELTEGTIEVASGACSDAAATVGIGAMFANTYPEFFAGCGCKRGVLQVMNRWDTDVEESRIENVARTIHNKNPEKTVAEIVAMIKVVINGV
jgi:hypothetical protein